MNLIFEQSLTKLSSNLYLFFRRSKMKTILFVLNFAVYFLLPFTIHSQQLGILSPRSNDIQPIKKIDDLRKSASIKRTLFRPETNGVDTLGPYPGNYDYLIGGWSQDIFFEWFDPEVTCTVNEVWIYFYRCGTHNSGSLQLYKTDFPVNIPENSVEENGWVGYYGAGWESCGPTSADGSWNGSAWGYDPLKEIVWGGESGVSVSIPGDFFWIQTIMADYGEEPVISAGERFAVIYTVGGQDWTSLGRQDLVATTDYGPPYPGLKFYDNTDANPNGGPSGELGWHVRNYTWDMYVVVEYSENSPPSITPILPVYTVLNADSKILSCHIKDVDAADSSKTGVANASFFYKVNSGSFQSIAMELMSGIEADGYWEAALPEGYMSPGDELTFYFQATDKAGKLSTSDENSFSYFEKKSKLLAFYNDVTYSAEYILPFYFARTDHNYDVWSGKIDGPLTEELVSLYNDIVQLDGYSPVTMNDDVVGAWLAGGSRNLFWSSQEWGFHLSDGRDSTFTLDDWHNMYLGIRKIGPQDINFTEAGSQTQPFRILPDSGDALSGAIFDFLGDSLQLYYNPYYELDFFNFIDAFSMSADSSGDPSFYDAVDHSIVGIHKEYNSAKTVFLAFDQLGMDTAYPDMLPNYDEPAGTHWIEHDVYSILDAALDWFGTPVSVENGDEPQFIEKFSLEQNFPNPFNPTTKIRYSLSSPGHVKLSVYNVVGQKITELVDDFQHAGVYEMFWDASELSSGVYFYRLETGSVSKTKKMLLLR